jgi:xanthine/uracil permease
MGLQHAFTMVGNVVVTPPFVIFRFSVAPDDPDLQAYAIAAALITSGFCTLIQVSKIPIPYTENVFGRQLYLGSGILGVTGTSIAFLPIYEIAIN